MTDDQEPVTQTAASKREPTLPGGIVKKVQVPLPLALHSKLRHYSYDHGTSISAVIRDLVEGFLDGEKLK